MRRNPLLCLIPIVFLTACGPTWRTELRRGNYSEACVQAEQLGQDGLHRAANERVSREYTAQMSFQARVEEVRQLDGVEQLAEHLIRDDYRIVRLRGPQALELRAWVEDEAVWLPAGPLAVRAVLIEAVGLRASERPAPLAQAAAERIDRKVRRFSSGTVDPRLRRKEFGAVPECPDNMTDCTARRRTFNALDRAFAQASECSEPSCEQLYVVERTWQSMGLPGARLEVTWDVDQCRLSHFVDVEAGIPLSPEQVGEGWMRVSPPLTRCTLERFGPDGCTAGEDE